MAQTPFDYFRKHTGAMMVVLCALLMLAFIVADPLMQYLNEYQGGGGGSRRDRKKVAVSWEGGALTEGELDSLVSKRRLLMGFLTRVYRQGAIRAIEAGAPSAMRTTVAPLQLATEFSQGVEQDVLQTRIYAQAAEQAGMVISDDTIADYLEALGRDRVSREDMRKMMSNIRIGRGTATPEFMFPIIREALLARNYEGSYAFCRYTNMPLQRWQDWLKLNDRVVVETAGISVDSFTSDVADPSDTELTEYYDKYKEYVPQSGAPTPGFRIPTSVQVQYVKADFLATREAVRDQVTDEEIAEFYEANKATFEKSGSDLTADEDDLEVADEEEPADDKSKGEEKKEEKPSADTKETPAVEDAPKTSSEPAAEKPASPEASDSGEVGRKAPFRLVAFQEDTPAKEAAKPVEEKKETSEPPKAEAPAAEPAKAADEKKEEADAPLDDFLTKEEDAPADMTPGDSSDKDTPDAESEEKPVEYQPLEEVKDEIRDELAGQKAIESMRTKMTDLNAILSADYDAYAPDRLDAEALGDTPPDPPKALVDWETLAADNGLEYGKTDILTRQGLIDSPSGKLFLFDEQQGKAVNRPLYNYAFQSTGMTLFQPAVFLDTERNWYLAMKVVQQDSRVPELEEIRDQVVAAWKKEKGAELALEDAKQQAKQAQDAGGSLSVYFAGKSDIKVDESERFAWNKTVFVGEGRAMLTLDSPGTVEKAGVEFMKAVFSLGPGEFGAALDSSHENAYLFRIVERERTRQQLREDFVNSWQDRRQTAPLEQQRRNELNRAVLLDLLSEEEPDWKRPPDRPDLRETS